MLGIVIREVQDIIDTNESLNSETVNVEGLDGSLFLNGKTTNIINIDFLFEEVFLRQEDRLDVAA